MLFRHAWQELRQHPSRFLATVVAIVMSVAFLSATQVFGATESNAIRQRQALYASKADLVAETYLWHSGSARERRDDGLREVEAIAAADPRVAYTERFSRVYQQVRAGDRSAGVTLTSSPEWPLRWFTPTQGELPTGSHEIMLNEQTARTLGVGVGDQIQLNIAELEPLTVVGLTDERGYADPPAYVPWHIIEQVDANFPPANYSVLVFPNAATKRATPGSSGDGVGVSLLIKLKDDSQTDLDAMVAEYQQELTRQGILRIIVHLKPADQVRSEAAEGVSSNADWMARVLSGAGAVSLVVGALIIATTFSILVGQRRRQVGLLRAVGASRGQVMRRFAAEAVLLGVLGSLIGVPLGLGLAALASRLGPRGVDFGLQVDWTRLLLIGALGIVVTVASALLPIRGATKVHPLEALQPVGVSGSRAALVVLGVGCLLAAVGGAALLWWALEATRPLTPTRRLLAAAGGGAALAVAVMASSALWVPALTRLLGRVLGRARPELRLAVANTGRNPLRVGATATMLMLAVGLMVTVQVGAATGRQAAYRVVDQRYPADIAIEATGLPPDLSDPTNGQGPGPEMDENGNLVGFRPGALEAVRTTPGVLAADIFETTSQPVFIQAGFGMYDELPVARLGPKATPLLSTPIEVGPRQLGMSAEHMGRFNLKPGAWVVLNFWNRPEPLQLEVVEVNLGHLLVLHPDTFDQMVQTHRQGLILAKITDPDEAATVIAGVNGRLMPQNPGMHLSGGAELKANVSALLDGVTLVLTGLLGVAALVALVGVSNTLGLSVMERTRESALLRALGLQRRGLRWMLLLEAGLLSLIAIAVGLAGGVVLGWAGVTAVAQTLSWPTPPLTIDPAITVLTCAAVLVAGIVASIIPGRRAALAAPVDALADVG